MQVCPSLLVKKDRGRPIDPKARPRAYGKVNVASNVPGVELLEHDDSNDSGDGDGSDESAFDGSDDDNENDENIAGDNDEENQLSTDVIDSEEDDNEDDDAEDDDSNNSMDEDGGVSADDGNDNEEEDIESEEGNGSPEIDDNDTRDDSPVSKESKARKRKRSDFDGQLITADTSLRALKRMAEAKGGLASSDLSDGILSNEDFQRIKKLKVR